MHCPVQHTPQLVIIDRVIMSCLTDVPESLSLITHLEQELKSKKMLFTKQHLQLDKIIGEG